MWELKKNWVAVEKVVISVDGEALSLKKNKIKKMIKEKKMGCRIISFLVDSSMLML